MGSEQRLNQAIPVFYEAKENGERGRRWRGRKGEREKEREEREEEKGRRGERRRRARRGSGLDRGSGVGVDKAGPSHPTCLSLAEKLGSGPGGKGGL